MEQHPQAMLLASIAQSGCCPALRHLHAGAPHAQALQELRKSPLTTYDEKYGAACSALLQAQRAGAEPAVLQALAADLCGEVSISAKQLHKSTCQLRSWMLQQQCHTAPVFWS